ncbi:unnamed protein product [Lampetra planeri]
MHVFQPQRTTRNLPRTSPREHHPYRSRARRRAREAGGSRRPNSFVSPRVVATPPTATPASAPVSVEPLRDSHAEGVRCESRRGYGRRRKRRVFFCQRPPSFTAAHAEKTTPLHLGHELHNFENVGSKTVNAAASGARGGPADSVPAHLDGERKSTSPPGPSTARPAVKGRPCERAETPRTLHLLLLLLLLLCVN